MPSDVDVSSLSYEEALADLEALITRLERGDVDLDEAVAFYQRGSALAQRCAALLDRTDTPAFGQQLPAPAPAHPARDRRPLLHRAAVRPLRPLAGDGAGEPQAGLGTPLPLSDPQGPAPLGP